LILEILSEGVPAIFEALSDLLSSILQVLSQLLSSSAQFLAEVVKVLRDITLQGAPLSSHRVNVIACSLGETGSNLVGNTRLPEVGIGCYDSSSFFKLAESVLTRSKRLQAVSWCPSTCLCDSGTTGEQHDRDCRVLHHDEIL